MGHDVLRVLGSALRKVIVGQSSFVNGPDANWDDIAAQVILQCDGQLAVISQKEYDTLAGDAFCNTCSNEPVPVSLTQQYYDMRSVLVKP